jgi:hypothetical protein
MEGQSFYCISYTQGAITGLIVPSLPSLARNVLDDKMNFPYVTLNKQRNGDDVNER